MRCDMRLSGRIKAENRRSETNVRSGKPRSTLRSVQKTQTTAPLSTILKKNNIHLNRKVLAEIAYQSPEAFKQLVKTSSSTTEKDAKRATKKES